MYSASKVAIYMGYVEITLSKVLEVYLPYNRCLLLNFMYNNTTDNEQILQIDFATYNKNCIYMGL